MKAIRLMVSGAFLFAAAAMIGCHSSGSSPTTQDAATTQAADKTYPPAPAGTPLAQIKVGMESTEVTALIGPPTNTSAYVTGKAFIPFYYGGDTHRIMYHYKGQGRVILSPDSRFTSGESVIEIEYDPTEVGY